MLKKDVRNLLVNTKIRSIHFLNIVMLCECTQCVVSVFFILLFVCMFVFSFLCATILVNKDAYTSPLTKHALQNYSFKLSYSNISTVTENIILSINAWNSLPDHVVLSETINKCF